MANEPWVVLLIASFKPSRRPDGESRRQLCGKRRGFLEQLLGPPSDRGGSGRAKRRGKEHVLRSPSQIQRLALPQRGCARQRTGSGCLGSRSHGCWLRVEFVRQRESFVFETVFSDPVSDKLAFLKQTAQSGYAVVLC